MRGDNRACSSQKGTAVHGIFFPCEPHAFKLDQAVPKDQSKARTLLSARPASAGCTKISTLRQEIAMRSG